MKIYVKSYKGNLFEVDINENNRIIDLKRKLIEISWYKSIEYIQLIFDGEIL